MKKKTTWKNLTKQNHKYELIKSGMIKQQQQQQQKPEKMKKKKNIYRV